MIGTRLGPYEITAKLGEGGMGEVYRARDTRLERTVAIKVLASHVAHDDDLRARFEREARAISALNHPHICTLHDVGHQDGVDYLVMELVEGESLAERLARGALPLDQVLRCGEQIADALDRAHRQGIVHRDLKPGNVMLTKTGIKLLDFGLAKLQTAPGASLAAGLAGMPTELPKTPLTGQGMLLGTFQYMAPEQLEGKDADARGDIFAFGCVLYEMATGKRAFAGSSPASLISAIMKDDPQPISALQPLTPPAFERLVRTCLEKDPDRRWQSARDVALQLADLGAAGQVGVAAPDAARRHRGQTIAWTIAFAAVVLAVGTILWTHSRRPEAAGLPVQAAILPPAGSSLPLAAGLPALSPDGRRLAFVAAQGAGPAQLWVRPLAAATAQALAGTERAAYPFWSPDGRSLGFFADGKLKKIATEGGPAQTICDAPAPRGGSWNRDGVILFAPNFGERIVRVPAAGGEPVAVTEQDAERHDYNHRWPVFLPDGQHFLFFVRWGGGLKRKQGGIAVGSLAGGKPKLLLEEASNAAYSQEHLLFLREGDLVAQRFDPRRLELVGEAFPVAERVGFLKPFDLADFTASEGGTVVYLADPRRSSQLFWFDRAGKRLSAVDEPGFFSRPRLSPDGRDLVVVRSDPRLAEGDLWLYDTLRGGSTRLSFDPRWLSSIVWSPDSKKLLYSDGHRLIERTAGASAPEQTLEESATFIVPTDWSPDGESLLAIQLDAKTGWDLWQAPFAGERALVPILRTPFQELDGRFSPDGRWLAYSSNESGSFEVYVRAFRGEGGPWQISRGGGSSPRWRRDGREMYYVSGFPAATRLMAVEVKAGPSFEPAAARELFGIAVAGEPTLSLEYDVTPDGQRFLVNVPTGEEAPPILTLLTDWRSILGR